MSGQLDAFEALTSPLAAALAADAYRDEDEDDDEYEDDGGGIADRPVPKAISSQRPQACRRGRSDTGGFITWCVCENVGYGKEIRCAVSGARRSCTSAVSELRKDKFLGQRSCTSLRVAT